MIAAFSIPCEYFAASLQVFETLFDEIAFGLNEKYKNNPILITRYFFYVYYHHSLIYQSIYFKVVICVTIVYIYIETPNTTNN